MRHTFMRTALRLIVFIPLFGTLFFCHRPGPQQANLWNDPTWIRIMDFSDRRMGDSLYPFFHHPQGIYREAAALAFASIQDTLAIDNLGPMVYSDAEASVRKAAAYALGQMKSPLSVKHLLQGLESEKEREVIAEILEALGKTWTSDSLRCPSCPKAFRFLFDTTALPPSPLISMGRVSAYYRLALRKLPQPSKGNPPTHYSDSLLAAATLPYLDARFPENIRARAAHVLSRVNVKSLVQYADVLQKSFNDPSPEVRMGIALAFRKNINPEAIGTLKEKALHDPDDRVRANAIKGLQDYPLSDTQETFLQALRDPQANVRIQAGETLLLLAPEKINHDILSLARQEKSPRVQGLLFEVALSATCEPSLVNEIIGLYQSTQDPYAKSAWLKALSRCPGAFKFLQVECMNAQDAVIRTAAATALVANNRNGKPSPQQTKAFANLYKEGILKGDIAVVGIFCEALSDPALGFKSVVKDITFLKEAREKLLPIRDNETLQGVEGAIHYFEGGEKKATPSPFNHPIPWEYLKKHAHLTKALIKTTKGHIVIKFFPLEAPGSVANFMELAEQGYFNGKSVHRVVPNFVIQTGCKRGDGWGSEDYSIRSEFSQRRYKTGSVGMASAGKDTEGTQWFITHSPTPHLDGRYTIFAEVESGMEAVHAIEVGDKILEVTLME